MQIDQTSRDSFQIPSTFPIQLNSTHKPTMYRVEEVPDSTAALTPGWTYAYVPDTGFDPAKAAITPALGRKRGVREPAGRGDLSSRQQTAIIRHLAELDRENHRDVPIPVKSKETAGRGRLPIITVFLKVGRSLIILEIKGTRTKSTQNVRRILASQKTFRNFLDDEEASLAQQSTQPISSSSRRTPTAPSSHPKPSSTQPATRLIKTEYDSHPLLRSYTPPAPSDRIMQALLAEPPLSYNAARAGPPGTGRAERHFCAMCGHWGKIRCKHCHVRTCGLECFRLHEDSRCGAFF